MTYPRTYPRTYPYDSSAWCLQSDRECQGRARRAYEGCLASEGEVLAKGVAECDGCRGKRARIRCLDRALGRFSERLERCLGQARP